MTANRAGEDHPLEVSAFVDQVVDVVAMGDARHVLIDDGPLIEFRGGVVRSRRRAHPSRVIRVIVRGPTSNDARNGLVGEAPCSDRWGRGRAPDVRGDRVVWLRLGLG